MIAVILNSGVGSRMGEISSTQPKCLTKIRSNETILGRQLRMLEAAGIQQVVITTGQFDKEIKEFCNNADYRLQYSFVLNPDYRETNYIYSLFCAKDKIVNDDVILMHGDLVFEYSVLLKIVNSPRSLVAAQRKKSNSKDFKAIVENNRVIKIAVDIENSNFEIQPLYKCNQEDWTIWMNEIVSFCDNNNRKVYAEDALNKVLERIKLEPLDIGESVCSEVDNQQDLSDINTNISKEEDALVYLSFSTDMVHSGHIAIIRKAEKFGKLVVGILSDEAIASYKRFPLLPFEERKSLFENIKGIYKVVEQRTLSYNEVLNSIKPNFVVHGDDWKSGFQKPIRDEVLSLLVKNNGTLIEYPYARDEKYEELEKKSRAQLSIPDFRRSRLSKILSMKGCINAIEAHSGITGLIAENTKVVKDAKIFQFDAMWISSLCDSTSKGKPDIELVDMTSRFQTIDEIMEVTSKPIIFDGDTGGLLEHFVYTVRSLERMGVSMIIIEDKTGLKKNSLFGNEIDQTQDSIENFCEKISAGKKAQKTRDFMICARVESLILEKGMQDALNRAIAYIDAGADAIMIHSRKKDPSEIKDFIKALRNKNNSIPIVIVPTSFNSVYEDEWKDIGANIIIYANHLTRSGFPAMQNAARLILENQRSLEADEICMPFNEIIRLIPEE